MQFRHLLNDEGHLEHPYIRGVLYKRVPEDLGAPLTKSVIVTTLYSFNPTPTTHSRDGYTERHVPIGGWRCAIFATSSGVLARSVVAFREDWGQKMIWPFDD